MTVLAARRHSDSGADLLLHRGTHRGELTDTTEAPRLRAHSTAQPTARICEQTGSAVAVICVKTTLRPEAEVRRWLLQIRWVGLCGPVAGTASFRTAVRRRAADWYRRFRPRTGRDPALLGLGQPGGWRWRERCRGRVGPRRTRGGSSPRLHYATHYTPGRAAARRWRCGSC